MTEKKRTVKKGVVLTIIACLLIVAITGGIVWYINNSEPVAQRETATKRNPMLVEAFTVSRQTYHPQIKVLGRVEAAREVMLRPRITGEVIRIADNFEPGAMVQAGDVLVTLDPADFEIALAERQSELQQVEADLAIEKGQQQVARQEFALTGQKLESSQRALVLREPQLKTVRARLEAARAAVAQAQLELDRTSIKAPFDAQVVERMVNLGSQVERGNVMAQLIGISKYWVIATVPLNQLKWISFGQDDTEPSRATIKKRGIWEDEQARHGVVQRFIGTLDEQTRLARVLITVEDPLALNSDSPPLVLDAIVQTIIEGRPLENVVRLDRDFLRPNDTVWVMQDGKLSIRKAKVVFRDANYAYIEKGLEDGDNVVVTSLSRVREGAELRTAGGSE
ncbi:MAG: efflux RND transporter periplasmic adaptor subunit [Desulfocapsaceae bacterium]|nr:efflux RND transporter periplasmic adaptor subunit [Desulfocapsaceae bacterium]